MRIETRLKFIIFLIRHESPNTLELVWLFLTKSFNIFWEIKYLNAEVWTFLVHVMSNMVDFIFSSEIL